jgi:hypothetical protein
MIHRRRTARSLAAGVGFGLLVLAGFTWLARFALPSGQGAPAQETATPPASATATTAPPTPDTTVVPPATPVETEPSPVAPCRVVGAPLALDETGDDRWAWSTLQNIGETPVRPSAIQLGWTGPFTLTQVVLEVGGGNRVALFGGATASPALATLASPDGKDAIGPGQTARLGMRFTTARSGAALVTGPAVVFFAEGCTLALSENASGRCALNIGAIRPAGNNPLRIAFSVTNRGTSASQVTALDVTWPVDANGAITALYIDGRLVRSFTPPLADSPGTLRLDRLLADPVVVGVAQSVSIWLEFERPAAHSPYAVTVATRDGCLVSGTTWLDAPGCGVVASDVATRGATLQLRLSNSLPVSQTLGALDVFWPAGANGPLVALRWDGTEIWRGRVTTVPASLALDGSAVLRGRATARLELEFDPPTSASDNTSGAVSGGDYTLVAGFRGGCQIVFSTQRGPSAGCRVASGDLARRQGVPEVQVNLANTSGAATLGRLAVSWPARNGPLVGAWLGATPLFQGRQPPGSEAFTIDVPSSPDVRLGPNTSAPLRLAFGTRASRHGYGLALSFTDALGASCAQLLVTAPQTAPDCHLDITRVALEGAREIEATLVNNGQDEVEVRFVNLVWPTNDGHNRLLDITLIDPDDVEYALWTGAAREVPARIPLSGLRAAIIDPGEVVRMRLHFDELFGLSSVATQVQLTVGTAEGCQASFPGDGEALRAERDAFHGMILDLPRGSPWGWWTIEIRQSAVREVRPVRVGAETSFEPSAVTPRTGDLVRVEALQYDDGWRAARITFLGAGELVQYIGRITEVSTGASGGGHPSWIRINAFAGTIRIVDDTRVDGAIEIGALVEVEGMLDAEGGLTATRVLRQASAVTEVVSVRGVVQDARDAPELGPSVQIWTVDKYRVQVDMRDPDNRWLDPPYDRHPEVGDRVEVRGRITGTHLVADKVARVAPPALSVLDGTLTALPAGGGLGTWSVRLDDGRSVDFLVETAAVVDTRSAPAVAGVRVHAVAQELDGGRLTALSVRTDWPDG